MRSHQSINNTTNIVIHRQLTCIRMIRRRSPVAGDFKQAARMHSLLCLITNSYMWSNENAQYRIDLTLKAPITTAANIFSLLFSAKIRLDGESSAGQWIHLKH